MAHIYQRRFPPHRRERHGRGLGDMLQEIAGRDPSKISDFHQLAAFVLEELDRRDREGLLARRPPNPHVL